MIALADCNNFFVSCERVFRPDLNGKPVVVLSNNDGCAISRSNEAKALGIKMGDPLFKIQDIVKRCDVKVFSGNMSLYGDLSNRVHSTLRQFVPAIEIYSIDEAFLDLRGTENVDYDVLGHQISAVCLKNVGIPISVGIAPTKTLAKIASKLCKQYPKLKGACYMHKPEDIEKVLKKFPLQDVWGIGRRNAAKLKGLGLDTAYDFAKMSPRWVQSHMGIMGIKTQQELNGIACIEFEDSISPKKTICQSRSFASKIVDLTTLAEQVCTLSSMVAMKLRKQNSVCKELMVFLMTDRFQFTDFYTNQLTVFEVATDSSLEINAAALLGLKEIYDEERQYKKAGVIACTLLSKSSVQTSLFDDVDREKHNRLMQVVDDINESNGKNTILFGSEGRGVVVSNRKFQSPAYTTEWDDIPGVNFK